MSSPWFPLLLFAVASAGPVDIFPEEGGSQLGVSTLASPSLAAAAAALAAAASTPAPTGAPVNEERAVPAATLAPPSDGQYCTVDGAVFHNGDRLPASADPDPCRACYCQGGESVCTRVHCYRRPDCAPRHVPGSCCPKYDNCPPAPEERSPEPRVKDAATQTDTSVEPTATPEATSTATTPVTTTTTDEALTTMSESTETSAFTSTTSQTTTSPTMTSPTTDDTTTPATTATTGTWSAESTSTATTEEDEETASATNAYPPGINLQALHEHLPFLSPGDANGPNT